MGRVVLYQALVVVRVGYGFLRGRMAFPTNSFVKIDLPTSFTEFAAPFFISGFFYFQAFFCFFFQAGLAENTDQKNE